ncbi:hypothetical protein [Desulfospira joergensenii]|uniref:hypothetical protein n=1 Tax=Desulfospira joergensenii TaxID=53329 RepID=UPI0003B55246|nr:hypothetical protein [Desulfospira joergensenii]
MIHNWYDPPGFSEGLKRAFSFFNLGILIFSFLFVFSEFRFDWCEKLLGAYLLSNNDSRPEKGAVWEAGHDTLDAFQSLTDIISRQETARQSVRDAESFAGLASSLGSGEWVIIEREEFQRFYRSLPPSAARKIIDPARLVWLLKGATVDRIFCEGGSRGIQIYFIDAQNRVVQQLDLDRESLSALQQGPVPEKGYLEDLESFSGRIYPADEFFRAAFKLPPDMISDLIQEPELLLDQKGVIQRVGIWNQAENGNIRLGFEFEDQGETRVLFVQAREWAVWQLGLILKGEIQ